METVQLVLGPYQTFQAQWIRNWMAVHCVKNHFMRTYFDKFMLTCLRGLFFMKHGVDSDNGELQSGLENSYKKLRF